MNDKTGFTLVELSVVLIIIALILGGVVVGRDMIRDTEIRTIISDVNRFKGAARQFQEKYGYLPGDLPVASTYWGADSGCPAGSTAAPYGPRTVTCSGDGDGKIRNTTGYSNPADIGDNNYESLRVWQHLANAGFIEGLYSGVGYAGNYRPGVNIPASKAYDASGFIFFYSDPLGGTPGSSGADPGGSAVTEAYVGAYGNIIEYGGNLLSVDVDDSFGDSPALTPAEALSLDQKTDDGKPTSGNILSFTTVANPDCNDASSPPAYDTSNTGIACSLIFVTGL